MGIKALAAAVLMVAVQDREKALQALSLTEEAYIEQRLPGRIRRYQSYRKKRQLSCHVPKADRETFIEDLRRELRLRQNEAAAIIEETTDFLARSSLWHDISDLAPDFVIERLDKAA